MTQFFDFSLTQADIDLTTEFMIRLADDHHEYFSSDLFREYRLHERFNNPAKEIGAYFMRLKANGVTVPVGELPSEIPSNNKRKNDLFRWDWARWRSILKSRLDSL